MPDIISTHPTFDFSCSYRHTYRSIHRDSISLKGQLNQPISFPASRVSPKARDPFSAHMWNIPEVQGLMPSFYPLKGQFWGTFYTVPQRVSSGTERSCHSRNQLNNTSRWLFLPSLYHTPHSLTPVYWDHLEIKQLLLNFFPQVLMWRQTNILTQLFWALIFLQICIT